MEEQGHIEVRATKISYMPKTPDDVYQVDHPKINVGPGETFDIIMDCKEGFSVFLPYPGFFDKQEWEAQPVDPGDIGDTPVEQWWRVSMTRKPGNNHSPIREMAYCVYSKDLDNFAVGESPPRMTLEP